MKKYLSFVLLMVLLGIAFPLRAQVTIKIERLSKPDSLLPVQSPKDIFKTFIEEDAGLTKYAIEHKGIHVDYGLLALKGARRRVTANAPPYRMRKSLTWDRIITPSRMALLAPTSRRKSWAGVR